MRIRQVFAAGMTAFAVVALLAGCSGAGNDSMAVSSEMASADAGGEAMSAADEDTSAGFGYADEEAGVAADRADSDYYSGSDGGSGGDVIGVDSRQIIRTAEVTVTIEVDPEEGEKRAEDAALTKAAMKAAQAVRALANTPGGYVYGSDGYGSTVTITLRIPADSYDRVMERLGAIGTVSDRSESTNDVTGQMVDVTSRIATMKASVDRLRALMADADSLQNVIALESELTRREADLESLQRQRASLADAVALSTITVTVDAVSTHVATEPEPERSAFMTGLSAGWHGLQSLGRGAAAVGGALLPWLPLLVIVGLVALWVVRRRRHPVLAAAAGDALEGGPDVGQVDHGADEGGQPQ